MHSHNTKSEKRESELGGEARCLCPDPWERRPLCRLLHANPRWRRPLHRSCARIRGRGDWIQERVGEGATVAPGRSRSRCHRLGRLGLAGSEGEGGGGRHRRWLAGSEGEGRKRVGEGGAAATTVWRDGGGRSRGGRRGAVRGQAERRGRSRGRGAERRRARRGCVVPSAP